MDSFLDVSSKNMHRKKLNNSMTVMQENIYLEITPLIRFSKLATIGPLYSKMPMLKQESLMCAKGVVEDCQKQSGRYSPLLFLNSGA